MLGLWLLLGALPADALTIPPALEDRLIYYRSFDSEKADYDPLALPAISQPRPGPGWLGAGGLTSERGHLTLRSEVLSPHQPLSLSVWWSVERELGLNEGYSLVHFGGGKGFISLFGRGGPWCALQDTAAVVQVYYLPDIVNVNGIYDTRIRQTLELRPGVWHHAALTFAGGRTVTVYQNGRPVRRVPLQGRTLTAADGLRELTVGSRHGGATLLDELLLWQRTLTDEEIADYHAALRGLREAGHLSAH